MRSVFVEKRKRVKIIIKVLTRTRKRTNIITDTETCQNTKQARRAHYRGGYIMVYDYNKAIREDIRDYIKNNIDLEEWRGDRDGLEEKLNEDLWTDDSVTGNASGSYTFSTYEAEENLCHNLDLLAEACEEFGCSMDVLKDGAEACDVTIRCYLLGGAISDVLDELEDELEELEEA